MNIFFKNFGIDPLDGSQMQSLKADAEHRGKEVNGYAERYLLLDSGSLEASFAYAYAAWDGNKPVEFSYTGCVPVFTGGSEWRARIIDALDAGRLPGVWVKLMGSAVQKGWVLPVNLIHSDILPALEKDSEISIRITCYAEEAVFFESAEERPVSKDDLVQPVTGEILPFGALVAGMKEDLPEEGNDQKVVFSAKITEVRHFKAELPVPAAIQPFACVDVQTSLGPLSIVHSLADLSTRQLSLIKPGNEINVRGWLAGDVAIGTLANGACYDLASDLRVLADCIRKRSSGRSRSIFADSCVYYSRDGLRAQGPQEIVAELDRVAEKILKEDYNLGVDFGRLIVAAGINEPGLENGRPCLVFLTPDGQFHSLMFARTDTAGKISRLETFYDFFEGLSVFHGSDPQILTRDVDELMEANAKSRSSAPEPAFFDAPEEKARIHGDAGCFRGEPYFSFGDMWEVIDPDIQDNLDKFASMASLGETFSVIGSGGEAFWLDYPAKAPVCCRIIVAKENEKNELITLYPVLAGMLAKVETVARYDWENGVCGFVCGRLADGHSLSFFVPSYGASRERFKPGAVVKVELSGIAFSPARAERDSFTINKGPMYEIDLARFMQENPSKTPADFGGVTVDYGDSVILFPTETTCFYELSAKIGQISKAEFAGRSLWRLTIPVASQDGGDVLASLYADSSECSSFKPGDRINCLVWLCADAV